MVALGLGTAELGVNWNGLAPEARLVPDTKEGRANSRENTGSRHAGEPNGHWEQGEREGQRETEVGAAEARRGHPPSQAAGSGGWEPQLFGVLYTWRLLFTSSQHAPTDGKRTPGACQTAANG